MEQTEKERAGLYQKYKLKLVKINGEEISDDDFFFILKPATDMHARYAFKAYADSVRAVNRRLSDDINKWLTAFGWSRAEQRHYYTPMRVAMYFGIALGIGMGGATAALVAVSLRLLRVIP